MPYVGHFYSCLVTVDYDISPLSIVKRVEKYRNPLVAAGESIYIFILLIIILH